MRRQFLILVLVAVSHGLFAQAPESLVVFQPQIRFSIPTPLGWVRDTTSAKEMGLISAYHPVDTKWTNAPVVLYVNLSFKSDSNQTLDAVMKMDANKFVKMSQGVEVKEVETLHTFLQNKPIRIMSYRGGENDNYEHVAYIDEGLHVIIMVIGARNEENLINSLPAFHRLTTSYFEMKEGCCAIRP